MRIRFMVFILIDNLITLHDKHMYCVIIVEIGFNDHI